MDQIDVAGLRIAYERAGAGPPLVVLHGYVGDGLGTWRHQIDGLSDEFTVVAWDAPGAGRSSDPPESFGLADYADCLAGFVGALGLGRVHVVGLSFGGGLALELYRRHPTIPMTLVLAGAYAGWAGSLPPRLWNNGCGRLWSWPIWRLPSWSARWVRRCSRNRRGQKLSTSSRQPIVEFHPSRAPTMARSFAEADLRDVLPRVDVPTLLLYGDKDVRAPLEVAEALHAAIPTSRLVVLPGVGHVSCVEAPERFNREIREFLHETQVTDPSRR